MEVLKMKKRLGRIYGCLNMNTGRVYTGQTITSLKKRWQEHLNAVNQRSKSYFHCSIRKHGAENFCVWIIEDNILEDQLTEREQYYIDTFNTMAPYGYNTREAGPSGSLSEETKQKISESLKGKKHSEETKQKMSEKSKGRKHTEETKRILSEKRKEEYKTRVHPRLGIKHSDESKQKMSEKAKGRKHSPETKLKMSNSRKGSGNSMFNKKHSEETKNKIRLTKLKNSQELQKQNGQNFIPGTELV